MTLAGCAPGDIPGSLCEFNNVRSVQNLEYAQKVRSNRLQRTFGKKLITIGQALSRRPDLL